VIDPTARHYLSAAGAVVDGRPVVCANVMDLSDTGRAKADGSPILRIEALSIRCAATDDGGSWGPLEEVVPDDGAAAWLLGVGLPADPPSYDVPRCGDGRCDRAEGETAASCGLDCPLDPFDGAPRLGWVRDTKYDFANLAQDGRTDDDVYWSAQLSNSPAGTVTLSDAGHRQAPPYRSL